MKNLEDLIGPQFCSLCDRNISQSVKIKSTDHESAGKPIVVCLDCHRTGAPVTTHTQITGKSVSETVGKYIVLDNLKFPLFSPDWSAKEELLLI